MTALNSDNRILSGMRPTGDLHLGHYHGVLKNWVELQSSYDCFFFVADWHALTTHYDDSSAIKKNIWNMVIDWIASGVNPESATIFLQSKVPEHAELHVLLSMMTPLSWLERVPTYKDQQEKLKDKDLSTLGFLGYPLLQSADILAYRAGAVPVGEDQLPHIEFTREIARRFNHIYGLTPQFVDEARGLCKKIDSKQRKQFNQYRVDFVEKGDKEALAKGKAMLQDLPFNADEQSHLQGFLEGSGKIILPEPQSLVTKASNVPGLDGQKMSKSYQNTISLRENPDQISAKIKKMPTDPARVKRTDPGDPEKCPVWKFHQIYSNQDTKDWVVQGCKSAGIGCVDCKAPVIDAVVDELKPIQERAKPYQENPALVKEIVARGSELARDEARKTLKEVKQAMGIRYR